MTIKTMKTTSDEILMERVAELESAKRNPENKSQDNFELKSIYKELKKRGFSLCE